MKTPNSYIRSVGLFLALLLVMVQPAHGSMSSDSYKVPVDSITSGGGSSSSSGYQNSASIGTVFAPATAISPSYGNSGTFWDQVASFGPAITESGSVYGKVISTSGSGLGNITVILFNAGNDAYLRQVKTDEAGNYEITGLADGSYHLLFEDNVTPLPGYARQYYSGQTHIGSASIVTITNQVSVTGVNATLVSGGAISGRITDGSDAGVSGIPVYVYYASQTTGNPIRRANATTDANGDYTIRGLIAGSYKVQFNGGALLQSRFYNSKPYLVGADEVAVNDGGTTGGVDTLLPAATATLSWAGTTHIMAGNGTVWDSIDAGINSFASTLTGMKLTVSGPEGFTYTFVDADRSPYLNGQLSVYKQFPTLAPGQYVFTLSDSAGNVISTVSDTHTAEPTAVPLVDTTTISYQRQFDGSYRFSWAPVTYETSPYYRLRVVVNDGLNSPIYLSGRVSENSVILPLGTFVDGISYLARIEVHDAPAYEQVTNRSNTAYVSFNPVVEILNGTCGSANGTTVSIKPITNLCENSSSPEVAGSGPWTWLCKGSGTGSSDASCRADLKVTSPIQTGSNVPVIPTQTINLNFTTVTTPGTVQVTSTTGPGSNIVIADGTDYSTVPGTSYDIISTAVTDGITTVCISYNPESLTVAENILRLMHNNGTAWEDITTSVDADRNRVCGTTASLSPFIIAYRKNMKPGDCDGNGSVSIAEVQGAINMYLGLMSAMVCVDTDSTPGVSISEVQKVINGYLGLN